MMSDTPVDRAYIAALWEYPNLAIAFFGVQYLTKEGQRLYEESGVHQEVLPALEAAHDSGLLQSRPMMTPEGPVVMLYWRSHEDLDRWARQLPHTRWWNWLIENQGKGVAFYHEIYQVKTAEAIYEPGTKPVGPALFCSLHTVESGEGKSKERQQRFADAAKASEHSNC